MLKRSIHSGWWRQPIGQERGGVDKAGKRRKCADGKRFTHGEVSVNFPGVCPLDERSLHLAFPTCQRPQCLTNLSLQEWGMEFIIYIFKEGELWA